MEQPVIAGIGELLWDILPDGEVLGGAPVNFAYHVNALGAEGIPVSTVGNDHRGKLALAELERKGVNISAVSVDTGHPTGYVVATLDAYGAASYRFPDNVAWDYLRINAYGMGLQQRLDAVCFGTLAQRSERSAQTLFSFLGGLGKKALKIFDVNLRQNFYSPAVIDRSLQVADILKLNDEEMPIVMNLLGGESTSGSFPEMLMERYGLEMVILTRGEQGSQLVTRTDRSEFRGCTARVVDTIGAGDCFTAAVTIGYLKGLPLGEINAKANRLASFVCSCKGAMPVIPDNLTLL